MSRLTFATGLLAGSVLTLIAMLYAVWSSPASTVPDVASPTVACRSIDCELLPSPEAIRLEQRLEAQGYRCTEAARLTDTIVVDVESGAAVVDFDRAQQIASGGRGWLRSYCAR